MTDETCCECGAYINFYSEGETYDYSENEDGKTTYLCQNCLEKIRSEAK